MSSAFLSPSEAAQRLGVSVKALRLYERHGLIRPVRSGNGWRAYGHGELVRLHQVLALRRLGLPLRRIAEILAGPASLDALLAVQETALQRECDRLTHALDLVRAARRKLAAGNPLTVDDLATLTTETTMTAKASDEELKALFEPLTARYFTPEEKAALGQRKFDQSDVSGRWEVLVSEAKGLMAKGDPASAEALDLARRWQALVAEFTAGDAAVLGKLRAIWKDAFADPKNAGKLPISPELMNFVGKAIEALKAKAP